MASRTKKINAQLKNAKASVKPSASQLDSTLVSTADPMQIQNLEKDLSGNLKQNTKLGRTKKIDEDSGQSLSAISSKVDFSQSEHNYYDVSGLKTNLFNNAAAIASSASNDQGNKRGAYPWWTYGAGGIALIGAGAALASSGGGGGGGGGSSAPTPTSLTFDNFHDFCHSATFLTPTSVSVTTSNEAFFALTEGFTRSEYDVNSLPSNLDYEAAASRNVSPSGLAVTLANEDAYATISAYASAGEDEPASDIIWAKELSITSGAGNTNDAVGIINVTAYASGNGNVSFSFDAAQGDAEIGICDLTIDLDSEHAIALASVEANAFAYGQANVIIENIDLSVHSSANTAADGNDLNGAYLEGVNAGAFLFSGAHIEIGEISISHETSMDDGFNIDAGYAQAGMIGSSAVNPSIGGFGEDAILTASSFLGGNASVTVQGNISIEATTSGIGDDAVAGLLLTADASSSYSSISARGVDGQALVDVQGSIDVTATTSKNR
ncbi:hypothetical protein MCESTEHM2_00894 [Candidatus Methylopumilus universalis]|uniref:hypothetical protein n=1 Tax=Candidatus Methylopumilus universalis TaxID=2588536 RepID=UPI003BEF420D